MHRLLVFAVAGLAALVVSGSAMAWSWPADGDVLRPFALGGDAYAAGQHRGVDVAGPEGSPVRAPAAGTVSFAGSLPTYGRGVTIVTADGYAVTLVHLGSIGVGKGDVVAEGASIGTMGWSGEAEHSVPSVHLGIRVGTEPEGYVDPLGLLPPRPAPSAAPPAPARGPGAGSRLDGGSGSCAGGHADRTGPGVGPADRTPARRGTGLGRIGAGRGRTPSGGGRGDGTCAGLGAVACGRRGRHPGRHDVCRRGDRREPRGRNTRSVPGRRAAERIAHGGSDDGASRRPHCTCRRDVVGETCSRTARRGHGRGCGAPTAGGGRGGPRCGTSGTSAPRPHDAGRGRSRAEHRGRIGSGRASDCGERGTDGGHPWVVRPAAVGDARAEVRRDDPARS